MARALLGARSAVVARPCSRGGRAARRAPRAAGRGAARHHRVAAALGGAFPSAPGAAGPNALERVGACVPYLLPLITGLRYGRYFFVDCPGIAAAVLGVMTPVLKVYASVPLAGSIAFFALYLGVARNSQTFSRFVRFNAWQALLLDILLMLPGLVETVVRLPVKNPLVMAGYNALWLFLAVSVLWAIGSNLLGRAARLPLVANAVDAQMGYDEW